MFIKPITGTTNKKGLLDKLYNVPVVYKYCITIIINATKTCSCLPLRFVRKRGETENKKKMRV